MKLAKPFFRLPVRFDRERLSEEVAAIPAEAWARHPNDIPGNTSVRLISVDGGENDDVDGVMMSTPHLARTPYVRQVLASFGVVWSRSRLLKLSPRAGVPPHADINYHWFYRVRLHVPIQTHPDVRFHCDGTQVHMASGEAWVFDNWRLHHVDNPVDAERIHLVADTSGSASFWRFVGSGDATPDHVHQFQPHHDAELMTERTILRPVMPPPEVDLLIYDLQAELTALDDCPTEVLLRYRSLLDAFRRDWRQLYQLFGESEAGLPEFTKLRDSVRRASQEQSAPFVMRTNRVNAHQVLEGRVLRHVLVPPKGAPKQSWAAPPSRPVSPPVSRPVFILAAPRSGSTLLFETLAASEHVCTLGGEAHWLVEGQPELRPGAPRVASNRLDATHYSATAAEHIIQRIAQEWKDYRGRPLTSQGSLRFLEKTPKNALRIPFFERIFPDALFVLLWRDPRESLSSIIEAWRSGDWKTYNGLPGFDGPWSLILPPGWQSMNGRSLEDIAAFQWESTNRIVLDDLAALPRSRWMHLDYSTLCHDPTSAIQRICAFTGIPFNGMLAARLAAPLPLSRQTQTPPARDKWRRNEAAIARVMPALDATWRRLKSLG